MQYLIRYAEGSYGECHPTIPDPLRGKVFLMILLQYRIRYVKIFLPTAYCLTSPLLLVAEHILVILPVLEYSYVVQTTSDLIVGIRLLCP